MGTKLLDEVIERLLTQFIQRDTDTPTNVQKLFEDIYSELDKVYDFVLVLEDGRYLDSSTGVWLDYIGEIVGIEREYKEVDKDIIFSFKMSGEANDYKKGFLYEDDPVYGGYLQSEIGLTEEFMGISTDKESDEKYRKKIKARSISNISSGTVQELYRHILDGFEVKCKIESPTPGLILITVYDFISKRDRNYIEKQGPVSAGVKIEFINWVYND